MEEASTHEHYALKLVSKHLQYSWETGRREALTEVYCMRLALEEDLPFLMPLYRSWDDEEYIYLVLVCLALREAFLKLILHSRSVLKHCIIACRKEPSVQAKRNI